MLDNNTYNLMKQLVQEHKSLWRIKNAYKEDAQNSDECQKIWKKITEQKEATISELLELLKKELN